MKDPKSSRERGEAVRSTALFGVWVEYDKAKCASIIGPAVILSHQARERTQHGQFLGWNRIRAKITDCKVQMMEALQSSWRPMHSKLALVVRQLRGPSSPHGALTRLLHQGRHLIHKRAKPSNDQAEARRERDP